MSPPRTVPSKLPLPTPSTKATLDYIASRLAENGMPPSLAAALERRRESDPRVELEGIVRELYDVLAPEILGLRRLRRKLVERAEGDVLEVAIGTGKNLVHYPKGVRLTGVDVSQGMLSKAKERAERVGLAGKFEVMNAEDLPVADETFDTVVDTMSLCTFPNPVATLKELGRVCRKSGRVLLLEHGRSDRSWLGRFQDRRAGKHAEALGCHWNREPLELVAQSGLRIVRAERHFFGVFHLIEAAN